MSAVFDPAGDAFWADVSGRTAAAVSPVLLLERWPRGAGMRSWYLLQSREDVTAARRLVRPGAGLTAYFAIQFTVSGAATPDLRARAEDLLTDLGPNDELIALTRASEEPLLDVEYVSDADELSSWLECASSRDVWICRYPDWPPNGEDALTAVVPDDDGVVRDHPY